MDSFHSVINEILCGDTGFDAILATGDISQDHSIRSYQRFEQGIAQLREPCFWLPGNHDYKPSMESVLPSAQIHSDSHILVGDHWQFILLDSQVAGVPHGELSDSQLSFLDETLASHPDRHTLLLIHHHPVLVGSQWLDQHTLHGADSLWEVLSRHDNVRALLGGHVHQDFDQIVNGVRVMTTPSTCVQFKPNSREFALDALSPGWRTLELFDDGRLETWVHRLENGSFIPDFSSGGY